MRGTGRASGEPVPAWWDEVTVVEGMSYGAARGAVVDLGGAVSEPPAGSGGVVTFRHPLLRGSVAFWRSARELDVEGMRWAAPDEAVAWLAELLEVLWARERSRAEVGS
ncbi:MAG: hypothetical protein BWX64_00301 [Acidobacteria bacterium ADurb.Bin051]|nr:MAG: hypothetical protein BWX64_00301 [Acidobacteria bacterium ADurb.Bin051]